MLLLVSMRLKLCCYWSADAGEAGESGRGERGTAAHVGGAAARHQARPRQDPASQEAGHLLLRGWSK
jgi:hypothetical protein